MNVAVSGGEVNVGIGDLEFPAIFQAGCFTYLPHRSSINSRFGFATYLRPRKLSRLDKSELRAKMWPLMKLLVSFVLVFTGLEYGETTNPRPKISQLGETAVLQAVPFPLSTSHSRWWYLAWIAKPYLLFDQYR